MKVSTTKLENCQAILDIEAEASDISKATDDAYRKLGAGTAIPGFRPGKAPRQVMERFISKEALGREVVNQFIPKAYENALKEAGVDVIAEPEIEITKEEPITFKATVSLRPVVELGDYSKIHVEVDPASISEEDINNALESIRQQQGTWEPVERPVESGDLVFLDIKGVEDGKSIINQKGLQYEVKPEALFPLPGFAEQLVGVEKNQEKEFQLTSPMDHPNEAMRGKTVQFHIQISEVKVKKLSSLDDDFAKTVNFTSLEFLKERVTNNLKVRAEAESERKQEEAALDALLDISRIEFPPVLVEREIERLLGERGNKSGKESPPDTNLVEEKRPVAIENLRHSLALGKLVEVEKIQVRSEEIDTEIGMLANSLQAKAEEIRKVFNTPEARRSIEDRLLAKKALARLGDIASGKAEEGKVEDTTEKAKE